MAKATAEKYNSSKAGKLWQWSQLPDHMREHSAAPEKLIKRVRVFQANHGLTVDGKIGPKTFGAILLMWPQLAAAEAVQAAPEPAAEPEQEDAEDAECTGGHLLIDGKRVPVPFEVVQHEPFKGRKRRAGTLINSLVIHQSGTSSVSATERVLRKRGLGVHIMIDGCGTVHSFGDLARSMAHGNERNTTSIGIEVIQPYTRTTGHWQVMIDPSPTAWKKREAADTPAQLAALDALCGILTAHSWECAGHVLIDVPLAFPTQPSAKPSRGHAAWFDMGAGGIIAHGHRPGTYPAGHARAGQRVKGPHADARRTVAELYKRITQ